MYNIILWEMVEDGKVKLEKVETLVNVVDALTKLMSTETLWASQPLAIKSMKLWTPKLLQGIQLVGECWELCLNLTIFFWKILEFVCGSYPHVYELEKGVWVVKNVSSP